MNHRYEKEIAAFMRGQPLQFQSGNTTWYDFDAVKHESACHALLSGSDCLPFRIKPRTVKIGKREVEAPVLEPAEGQRLWFVGSDGEAYANTPKMLEFDIASGRAFATKEAATAAHDAITALLRGEA